MNYQRTRHDIAMNWMKILGLVVFLACASQCGEDHAQPTQRKAVHAFGVKGDITIDGIINEPAWERAEKIIVKEPYPWKAGKSHQAKDTATARLLWDKEYLYFAFEMRDRDIWCSYTNRDDPLPHEDVIELFIKPSADSPIYYELEISPSGMIFDLRWPKRGSRSDHWAKQFNFHCELATRIDGTLEDFTDQDEGWVVEGRIPFTDFQPLVSGTPTVGQRWRVNVCRYNYGVDLPKKQLSSWARYRRVELGFHGHEDFGELIFADQPASTN